MCATSIVVFLTACAFASVSGNFVHYVNETQEFKLKCPDTSDRVEWSRNNKSLVGQSGYKIENGVLSFFLSKTSLGEYICSTPDTGSHEVIVSSRPVMEGEATQHKNAINDETFVFECKGYGYPRPVVTWMRGNSSLDIDTSDTPRVSVKNSTFMDNAILKIKKVQDDDGGEYLCVASNQFGESKTTVLVSIKDKYAALWPFLGICVEVAVLCAIILVVEKRRSKKEEKVVLVDENEKSASDNKQGEELRQRK